MALNGWIKIKGVVGNLLGFDGGDGPQLKNASGVIEARNSGDSAYVVVRGADPSAANDLVTKSYGDTNYVDAGGALKLVEIPIAFGDAGSAVDSTFAGAVGGRVAWVKVDITTAFDADTDIEVGDTGDADRFVVAGDVKEQKVDLYEFPQYTDTIASVFRVTLAASAATAGAGRVLIAYSVPQA